MMTKRILSLLIITVLAAACMICAGAAVNEAYRIGDADGNKIIDLTDATLIQYAVVYYTDDADGMIALRGDVDGDGLDVADAAKVQRFLNGDGGSYRVGEWVYPEQPTEQPSLDEYELPFISA